MKQSTLSIIIKFLIISVAVAGGIWLFLWASKPSYPSFQRQADNYAAMKEELDDLDSILYPDLDSWKVSECQFFVSLDGRGRLAKPNGYVIGGVVDLLDLSCDLSLFCDPIYGDPDRVSVIYREVPIFISKSETVLAASFRSDGYKYKCVMNAVGQIISPEKAQKFCELGEAQLMEYVKSLIDQKYTD